MTDIDNSVNERSGNFHLPDVEIPEGVSIQLTQEIPRSKQLAEFYSNGVTCETFATITYLDRKVKVDCCGEMLLTFPSMIDGEQSDHVPVIVKYADQLEAAGIKDDTQLRKHKRLQLIANKQQTQRPPGKPGGLCSVSTEIQTIVRDFVSLRKYSYKRGKSSNSKFEPKEWNPE